MTPMAQLHRVRLNLELQFRQTTPEWWRDGRVARAIVDRLKRADLWLDFRAFGLEGARLKRVLEPDDVVKSSVTWKPAGYVLHADALGKRGSRLLLTVRQPSLRLTLIVEGDAVETRRHTLIDQKVAFTTGLHEDLAERAWLGPSLGVFVPDLEYRRVRPPPYNPPWSFGSLVDFVDPEFHVHHPRGDPEGMQKLLAAELPPGVSRDQRGGRGGLIVFRWVDDLRDPGRVADRLSVAEQWKVRVLAPAFDSDYNAHGDRREIAGALQPHASLTFYDAPNQYGYKLLVATDEGWVDEAVLGEASAWARARRLPDGTPLAGVALVTPTRSGALRIRDRAMAAGIDKVLYAADDGAWWDPAPPGLWVDAPTS